MANVDLADFMDVFPEVKVKTLSNLAQLFRRNEKRSQATKLRMLNSPITGKTTEKEKRLKNSA